MDLHSEILTSAVALGFSTVVETSGVEQFNIYYKSVGAPVNLGLTVWGSPDGGTTWLIMQTVATVNTATTAELFSCLKSITQVKVEIAAYTAGSITVWFNGRRSY